MSDETDSAVWTQVEASRLELCSWLDQVDPSEWTTPSLCPGWSIQAVVAHLTLSTRTTKGEFLWGILRNLGNFDRMEAERARARAVAFPPDQLIDQLREHAGSTQTTLGSSPLDALLDLLVHGQDMARPLGSELVTPPSRVVPALDHAIASRWYGARKRLSDISLTATDIEWTGGSGTDDIHGPAIDLLLVATGRAAGLTNLTGTGMQRLQANLS